MSYNAPSTDSQIPKQPVEMHRVYMLGAPGVGKAALISQFSTSECINAYEGPGKGENFIQLILMDTFSNH